jgi:hypothetical protein
MGGMDAARRVRTPADRCDAGRRLQLQPNRSPLQHLQ